MKMTGTTRCAYCHQDLKAGYDTWLTMALDHVVPRNVCRRLRVRADWAEDFANRALTCAACNSFDNRYSAPSELRTPNSWPEFVSLRDRVFVERQQRIQKRHVEEQQFFDTLR